MPLLFYDLHLTGHHVEFLYHLIKYKIEFSNCASFLILTHPKIWPKLRELQLPIDLQAIGVTLHHPRPDEMLRLSKAKSVHKRAEEELRIVNRVVRMHKVKVCYFMTLNSFQFALGNHINKMLPCRIRGILFNPLGTVKSNLPKKLIRIRKELTIWWMLRNKKIEHIYLLNNDKMANILNLKYKRKGLFVAAPDPVMVIPEGEQDYEFIKLVRPSKRMRFLAFGSLSSRKGIFLVLKALWQLPECLDKQIEIVFAGKIVENERKTFKNAVSELVKARPNIAVQYVDEFLPYGAIRALFTSSDVILIPYLASHASSGVVGHAALYGKPVIGPASGLLGRLIKTYNLGTAIPEIDAEKLSSAFQKYLSNDKQWGKHQGMQLFVKERHPIRFVETLLLGHGC